MATFKTKRDVVSSAKFLGIHLDTALGWSQHIDYLARTLASAMYALRRIKEVSTDHAARLTYFAMFHSRLSYGILFWGTAGEANRIFIFQKTALRILCNLAYNTSCRGSFKQQNILTLMSEYIYVTLKYVHKNRSRFCTNGDNHQYLTRNRDELRMPYHRLSSTQKYIDRWGARLYNALSREFSGMSVATFEHQAKRLLIQKECYTLEEFFL